MRFFALFLLLSINAFAQQKKYPEAYFKNPLNIPILLAGNFGECRPGHFHSGIDIKTEGRENLAVFAAAEGYISRVKMEPGGFGHGIYITHPNGYTTLYAHLNDFFPELQKLVHLTQYENQNWELDLNFTADKFPVKKGQQIAWSGNTGGSMAPHLHFEIRDTKTEHPLNPQLFGFSIKDDIAPVVSEIIVYNAAQSIYEQDGQRIKLKKKGSEYTSEKDTILCMSNEINLGVATNDFMNASTNTLSFYTAEWFVNDSLNGRLILDDIGYDETRYLNACADYKTQRQTGVWFNNLFLLPNNKLERIYSNLQNKTGKIILAPNSINTIRISLKDASGNESSVEVLVQQSGKPVQKECKELWMAGIKNAIQNPNLKLSLDPLALYDNICFETGKAYQQNAVSSRWKVHAPLVPLHKYFELSIKPSQAIPFAVSNKIVMVCNDGKSNSARAASLNDAWYNSSVRRFGDYWLAIDSIAPIIKPAVKSGLVLGSRKEIRFKVTDNLTSVKKLNATINNRWVCVEQHGTNWFYKIDEFCPKGKNKMVLTAIDESGNERKMDYYFTR